jgi:hypothetical protein
MTMRFVSRPVLLIAILTLTVSNWPREAQAQGADDLAVNVIESHHWMIQLPKGWRQHNASSPSPNLYFESVDGTKGAYILVIQLDQSDTRTTQQHLALVREISQSTLRNMERYHWVVLRDEIKQDNDPAEVLLDNLDKENHYRITERTLIGTQFIGRLTVHDYFCADLSQSDKVIAPLLSSFKLK